MVIVEEGRAKEEEEGRRRVGRKSPGNRMVEMEKGHKIQLYYIKIQTYSLLNTHIWLPVPI